MYICVQSIIDPQFYAGRTRWRLRLLPSTSLHGKKGSPSHIGFSTFATTPPIHTHATCTCAHAHTTHTWTAHAHVFSHTPRTHLHTHTQTRTHIYVYTHSQLACLLSMLCIYACCRHVVLNACTSYSIQMVRAYIQWYLPIPFKDRWSSWVFTRPSQLPSDWSKLCLVCDKP